ncbi:MAG: ABC transporter permease, partial [Hyphomicrobiales bacterium]|nr:ABC transporter permease [Hyphomicrobiales bacterium]
VGAVAVGVGGAAGVALGLAAAARGGALDVLLMRIVDFGIAFPALLTALIASADLGPGIAAPMAALAIYDAAAMARLTRNLARDAYGRDYVAAARLAGAREAAIAWRHALPNVAPALVAQATLLLAVATLAESALSYLGLGVQPPAPSWGRMLADAQGLIYVAPRLAIYPGLAIAALALGFNLLGDGIARRLDPRRGLTR